MLVDFGLALSDLDAAAERGRGVRHAGVHVPGAGRRPRAPAGRPHRHLRPRRHALRRAVRPAAVPRTERRRHPPPGPRGRAAAAPPAPPGRAAGTGSRLPQGAWRSSPATATPRPPTSPRPPPLGRPSSLANRPRAPRPLTRARVWPRRRRDRSRPDPAAGATPRPEPRAERRQVTLLQCACEARAGEDDDPTEQVAAFQAAVRTRWWPPTAGCRSRRPAPPSSPASATRSRARTRRGRRSAPPSPSRRRVDRRRSAAVGTGPAVVTEQPPAAAGRGRRRDRGRRRAARREGPSGGGAGRRRAPPDWSTGTSIATPAGEVRPRGAAAVRAFARPRPSGRPATGVDAADPARLTPLVGRDREVALLQERWELTAEGVQNVILLVADPGLGKSRLVRVLRDFVLGTRRTAPRRAIRRGRRPGSRGRRVVLLAVPRRPARSSR